MSKIVKIKVDGWGELGPPSKHSDRMREPRDVVVEGEDLGAPLTVEEVDDDPFAEMDGEPPPISLAGNADDDPYPSGPVKIKVK